MPPEADDLRVLGDRLIELGWPALPDELPLREQLFLMWDACNTALHHELGCRWAERVIPWLRARPAHALLAAKRAWLAGELTTEAFEDRAQRGRKRQVARTLIGLLGQFVRRRLSGDKAADSFALSQIHAEMALEEALSTSKQFRCRPTHDHALGAVLGVDALYRRETAELQERVSSTVRLMLSSPEALLERTAAREQVEVSYGYPHGDYALFADALEAWQEDCNMIEPLWTHDPREPS